MPLDAICLGALKDELAGQITGMKIDKVQQPERDLIILSLRGPGGNTYKLLISAGSEDPRMHITQYRFENPKAPPMFCMLLRKHISGARIMDITQPLCERVLILVLESSDAMGVKSEKFLIVEMIGRQSNIILRGSDGIIIDCLHRAGGGESEKRIVLPGLYYRDPPGQAGKLNPFDTTDEEFTELIGKAKDETAEKWLLSSFKAFSPLICRELVWRVYGDTDRRLSEINDKAEKLRDVFFGIIRQVKTGAYEPWSITTGENKVFDFSFTQIGQYEGKYLTKREKCFSSMLDRFFTRRAKEKRTGQRNSSTLKMVKTAHDRLVRKLTAQKTELEGTYDRDYLRECGDIIKSNFHKIKKGQQVLIADDFFSENGGVRKIKLDEKKSAQQNAANYYKAYNKAKNAQKILAEQIKNGEKELEYIESVIELIKRAENEQDLNEIRSELILTGYIKPQKQQGHKKQKNRQNVSVPFRFLSSGGSRISAGRNNLQNDLLTLKLSAKTDLWFHAQKIHGAHVIVSCKGAAPDDKTLQEAACIAAYYSAARAGGKVPVDYTLVRNVKKPSGGRPGMVIYTEYKTIMAEPDEELVNKLRD